MEDLPSVWAELRRVLRPGGRIVCIEFHLDCPVTRAYRALSRFRRHPCTFYRPEALAGLFHSPPFAAEQRMLDHCQYVVSARRTL